MAIYEYYCKDCDDVFTKMMSIKVDSSNELCPNCKKNCKKIPSLTSFKLQGSGWAKDGYK